MKHTVLETLRDPNDREGWEALLGEYEERIVRYISFLSATYSLSAADRLDVRQTALLRIILESARIEAPEAMWAYWKRIIRSCVVDFARVKRRYVEERPEEQRPPALAEPSDERLRVDEVLEHFASRSPLIREVLLGLLEDEKPVDTARRLKTTTSTIYVVRQRIRQEIRRLGFV